MMRNMTILGEGKGIGIEAQNRLHASDLWIERFHGGIFIRGEMSAEPMTNANLCRLDKVSIYGCVDTGIRVAGGDANQGIFTVDVTNCGGVHVWDDSFLGTLWIGCHVDTAPPTGKNIAYRAKGGAFLYCYSEGPTQSEIHYPAIIYAGAMALAPGFTGHHIYAAGPSWLGVRGAISGGEGSGVFGRIGDATIADVAISFVDNKHNGQDLRVHATPEGWWTMRDTNSGYLDSMAWSNVANTQEGRGQAWMPRGMWYGGGAGLTGQRMRRTTSRRGVIDVDVTESIVGQLKRVIVTDAGTLLMIPSHGIMKGDVVDVTAVGGLVGEHVAIDVGRDSILIAARADASTQSAGLLLRCRAEGYANDRPVSGQWSVGDRVWSLSPATDLVGWVCTASGSPGVWTSF